MKAFGSVKLEKCYLVEFRLFACGDFIGEESLAEETYGDCEFYAGVLLEEVREAAAFV
jgi:hypothetical protein